VFAFLKGFKEKQKPRGICDRDQTRPAKSKTVAIWSFVGKV